MTLHTAPVEYPPAKPDRDTGQLIPAVELAEIKFTAFASRSAAKQVAAR